VYGIQFFVFAKKINCIKLLLTEDNYTKRKIIITSVALYCLCALAQGAKVVFFRHMFVLRLMQPRIE